MSHGFFYSRSIMLLVAALTLACNSGESHRNAETATPTRSPEVQAAEKLFGLEGPVADILDRGIWMGLPGVTSFELFDWEGNHFDFSYARAVNGPGAFHWGTHHPRIRPGTLIPPGSAEEEALLILFADWVNRTLYPEEIDYIVMAQEERVYCDQITNNRCEMGTCAMVSMSTRDRFKLLREKIVGRQ